MYEDINQIQVKAETIANEFKKHLNSSRIYKFHLKSTVFIQTFNKIEFVKEEFNTLTNNKVNRDKFYEQIKDMKRLLENVNVNLEAQLSTKIILELFSREIAFLAFIKNEKEDLYQQVDRQMSKGPTLDVLRNEECEIKKKRICHLKFIADCVSFSSVLGGGIFMVAISI